MAKYTSRHGAWGGMWQRTLVLGGASLVAFVLGRAAGPSPLSAQPPAPASAAKPAEPPANSDYNGRVVAYIYNTIPITREELGEYLIQRHGADQIELLVNKRIIDHACQEAGIEVRAADVEASFEDDCRGLGVSRQVFLEQFLAARHKSELEWKEDVIRPRLQLTQLCRQRVHVEEQELRDAFEAQYGEKVKVRVLLFGPTTSEQRAVLQIYDQVRKSDEEFDRQARAQENSALAASGGQVKPIGRHCASAEVERAAFSLRPGEVSSVIGTCDSNGHPSGCIILKCDGRVPPDATKSYDKERENLLREVNEKKVQEMIKVVFKELHDKADPKLFIKPPVMKEHDMLRGVEKELKQTDAILPQMKKN
jgi:PPIC-type PPIASE domain